MNMDFLKLWIKALGSGKYKQARGTLVVRELDGINEEEDAFCCLGVACDLARKEGIYKTDRSYRNLAYLPSKIASILGIDEEGGFINEVEYNGFNFTSLAQMNDSGIKFNSIAKIIVDQMKAGNFKGT